MPEEYDYYEGRPKPKNPICAVAIIFRDGRVLMGLREYQKGKPLWTFPGGRCNSEERPEDTLEREVKEETGIDDLVIVQHLGVKDGTYVGENGRDQVHMYECTTRQEPKLMEPEKFIEWKWIEIGCLPENLIDPNDVGYVKRAVHSASIRREKK